MENYKNLLVRTRWTDFNITLQKCFLGDPVPRLFRSLVRQKIWPLGVGGVGGELIFPIYLYRKL